MERDAIVAWVRAAATAMELPAGRSDEAEVVAAFERLAVMADALEGIELDPEVEPLTVFVR